MMASGGPIDYSYSPSGSTIELIDLASNRQSSRLSSRSLSAGSSLSWHPKLTLYRLLVILSTVGLAAAKTATTCLNLTFASITVEWILGVAVFLFFHLLGVYEETSNRYFTWLFNDDSMDYLWALLEKYPGFYRPFYISDEIDPRLQAVGIHPPLTGYRIIITLVVAIVGLTKSALLYGQKPKEATTVECVFGVGIVTGLYWLGLYESSSTKVYPRLFHVDYSGVLPYFTETLVVLLHLFGLLFYSALTYGLYLAATMLASSSMFEAREGEGLPKRLVDIIVLSTVFWGTISFLALGSTMGAFLLLYRLGWRYRASRLGQFIARLPGIRSILYLRHKYWLPSRAPLRPRPRFFYLKRLIIRQIIKIPLNLLAFYVMVVLVLMYCIAGLLTWCSFIASLLQETSLWLVTPLLIISLFLVAFLAAAGAMIIREGYRHVVNYFGEAWKDFTVEVEVEAADVPAEAPFEAV